MNKQAVRAASRPSKPVMMAAAMLGTALFFALSSALMAQQAAPNGISPTGVSKETKEKVEEYRKTLDQLSKIQQKAVAANPELVAKQEAFQSMVQQEMAAAGFNADDRGPKLNQLAEKLQDEELSVEKRREIAAKIQANREDFANAREAALSKPEVKKSAESLQAATLEAMKEQNAKTDDLIAKLRSLRGELQDAMPPS